MQVSLKVIGGKNDGRIIKIAVPEFVIGRGETAHLRPQSDLISRAHCAILVQDGRVVLRDMESRNGTFLNEERVVGEVPLKIGDRLRVGRLEFEVLIDHAVAGTKNPKVEGVKEAAARTASTSADAVDEESITDWLTQTTEVPETRKDSGETRQFMLDETERLLLEQLSAEARAARDEKDRKRKEGDSEKAKEPGKLPGRSERDTADSRDAASQMLRKFFNRR